MAERNAGPIVGVTGHRPGRLGTRKGVRDVRAWVESALRDWMVELEPRRVLVGMSQGVDQWAAGVSLELGIPYVAAVPCAGQDARWGLDARREYGRLLEAAAEVVVVSPGPYAAWKMHARNRWIVNGSDVLLAVWDGRREGGTGGCVAYAETQGIRLVRIDPVRGGAAATGGAPWSGRGAVPAHAGR